MLTGLRGVGKTVLLNALRGAAVRRGLGHRQARGAARTSRCAGRWRPRCTWRSASCARPATRTGSTQVLGVLKSFAQREPAPARRRSCATAGSRASTSRPCPAGPTPATSRSTWSSCSPTSPGWPPTPATASRSSSTRCRTSAPDDVSALCAACHELSPAGPAAGRRRRRAAAPAGRAVGGASPTPSGCSATPASTGSTATAADVALRVPARDEDADFDDDALAAMYEATGGYPYFVQAYGKVAWDVAPRSPITAGRRRGGRARRPRPSWRSASSARATSGPRRPSASTCGRWPSVADPGRRTTPVPTAAVAEAPGPPAAVAVAGAGRAAEEGPGLLRPARPDRLHRAALRPVPARAGVTPALGRTGESCGDGRRR